MGREKSSDFPVPIRAEKPIFLVPNAAVPEEFFDIGERPERRQKNKPVCRQCLIKPRSPVAPLAGIKINERKIRNAVNDDVRHGKSIIGIKKDDPCIPANGSRRDDNILSDIQKTLEADVTASGIKAVRPSVRSANTHFEAVDKEIKAAIKEMDKMAKELSPEAK